MTYALIDNATLTGVQRITGEVETRSRDSIDTDIIALENFIQATLFYDELIAVDDYIPQHKDQRHAAFPHIRFLDADACNLKPIEQQASAISEVLRPEIKGGEFANDDFRNLFELLKTHIVCTWDLRSSVYYLTLKVLATPNSDEFDKYGHIAAGIFSELLDAKNENERPRGEVHLVDRFGNPIDQGYVIPGAKSGGGTTGGTTDAISAFVASLVWLANRSVYYSLSAKYLHADSFLYPIRQAYQQHYIGKTCHYGNNFAKNLVDRFSKSLSKDLIDIQTGGLATAIAMDLPVFAAWLAKETGNPKDIISAALQLKNTPQISEAREQLREIRKLFDESETGAANKSVHKIVQDVKNISDEIRIKYGLETKQGIPVTRLVQVYNTSAALIGFPALPDYDFKIKLPAFMSNVNKSGSGFSALYRNISDDLSTVWALGEARDILGSKVVMSKKGSAYLPKSEDPRYRYVHSHWKSPM